MAIIQTMSTGFKAQILEQQHDFRVGGSIFMLALYTSLAALDANTPAYTPSADEVVGAGYVAGGLPLVNLGVTSVPNGIAAGTGFADFDDLTFPNVTLTARGALIYNASPGLIVPNASVCVLDFGSDKTATASDFTIIFPAPGATTAIIRIA